MVLSIRAVGRGEAIFSPAIATRVLAYFAASPQEEPRPRPFPPSPIASARSCTSSHKGTLTPQLLGNCR